MPPRRKDVVPIAPAPSAADREAMCRERDAFVTSMAMLRNAADEASRTGLAYFNFVINGMGGGNTSTGANDHFASYVRAMSAPPPHSFEAEDGKKRRKRVVKAKDPNAPKKPATPFFLFCSEGRATVKGDLGAEAEFKDIQAELKARWEMLPAEEKQAWSSLYQVKLAEWKKINEAYQSSKAATQATTEDVATPSAPSAGGFTAVNHNKPISADETEDDEEEEDQDDGEAEADADASPATQGKPTHPDAMAEDTPEPQAEEDDEEEEEEEHTTTAAKQAATDSSLSPLPVEPEKPKSTPRNRKSRSTPSKPIQPPQEELQSLEKSTRKRSRAKKTGETEAPATPVVEEKKRGRKRRKSNTANE
ncbi:hypothetical protein BZA77DRAFT_345218 [Pyronema omphalodes]|nr:hypothetical protein BZA77DRAFT_345218 [Pyronema omphalodes]